MKFSGLGTALITPFLKSKEIDFDSLKKLIEFQVNHGVDYIVLAGTTGESATLETQEVLEIASFSKKLSKIPIVVGVGSNSTKQVINKMENLSKIGVDGFLVVSPYYNKPSQEGLFEHYSEISKASNKTPIILYNVPGRTAINMNANTVIRLSKIKNICCIKEASGDLEQMKEVLVRRPQDFSVLSGDDGMTLDLIRAGGDGVISVASNVIPDKIAEMVDYALGGNFEEAEKINEKFADMFDKLFIETNPIPAKYCLAKMGLCEMEYRLPMCDPEEENKKILDKMLHNYNLC